MEKKLTGVIKELDFKKTAKSARGAKLDINPGMPCVRLVT